MRRRGHLVSARSFPRWCRKPASTTWRPPSGASRVGIHPIRMRRNGITSLVPLASAARCSKQWSSEMTEHVIRLPDVGEGVAEAELVEWHVKVGDLVREDAILAAVMTDKATVEIPSPVHGEVTWLGAEIGDSVAVGSPLIRLKVDGDESSPLKEESGAEPPVKTIEAPKAVAKPALAQD